MTRSLLALVVGLAAVGAARADGLLPPPPGKKFVPVTHVVATTKAYPDLDFYLVRGTAPTKVEFGPDAPVKIEPRKTRGPGGRVKFLAVPKGSAEKYATAEAFADALLEKSVPGLAVAANPFLPQGTIDAKDARTAVTETHVVEKIDPKGGIVFRADKDAPAAPKSAPGDDETEFSDDTAATPARGGPVVAGLAAALAAALAGLWLVRRVR